MAIHVRKSERNDLAAKMMAMMLKYDCSAVDDGKKINLKNILGFATHSSDSLHNHINKKETCTIIYTESKQFLDLQTENGKQSSSPNPL